MGEPRTVEDCRQDGLKSNRSVLAPGSLIEELEAWKGRVPDGIEVLDDEHHRNGKWKGCGESDNNCEVPWHRSERLRNVLVGDSRLTSPEESPCLGSASPPPRV